MSPDKTAQGTRAAHARTPQLRTGPPPPPAHGLSLLAAKLSTPQLPPGLVTRPRLLSRLQAGVLGRVTLLSAGPGWGKTMLAASWATAPETRWPVAWVSLDTDDNVPTAFWSYVLAALRRCGAVPPQNELAELAVADPRHQEEHVRLIARGLAKLPQPVVLVLDDFHHIDNPAVLRGLEALLRYPSPLRLMLLTRSDPRLPLHRLRVAGELTEVRAADLAFRESEATALFHSAGLDLTADQRRILFDRTEGWPTGLRLAALFAGRPEVDRRIEDFSGDIGTVAEYLIEEVLAAQPSATRRFLLHTSVVERLCADLANALTDRNDGQRLLEQLEQENAFVVAVGPRKRWFRYHPLLADLLRHQLILEDPDLVPSLHRRAAQWFGAHGIAVEAVRHAVQARDWPLVGRLVITHAAPRLVSAEGPALMALLGEIPDNELSATAELGTCAALLRYGARDYAALPSVVARAAHSLPDATRCPDGQPRSCSVCSTSWPHEQSATCQA